jgi:hypothetical protein
MAEDSQLIGEELLVCRNSATEFSGLDSIFGEVCSGLSPLGSDQPVPPFLDSRHRQQVHGTPGVHYSLE